MLLLVATIMLAGCASNTDSRTPDPRVPPGTSQGELKDPETLLSNYEYVIGNKNLKIDFSYEERNVRYIYKFDQQDDEIYIQRNRSDSSTIIYYDGTTQSERIQYGEDRIDSVEYSQYKYSGVSERARPREYISDLVMYGDWNVERTTKHNGTWYTQYEYTGIRDVDQDTLITTYHMPDTGSMTVREDGLIAEINVRGTTEMDDQFHRTYTITVVNSNLVSPPNWLSKAAGDDPVSWDGGGCGTNDGDPSYDEDNDRDNDGLCDES
jgi:hypothetical protein